MSADACQPRRPAVDVVMPFFGSPAALEATLSKLDRLGRQQGDTVTVVYNGPLTSAPIDDPRLVSDTAVAGSYFARNAGAARGTNAWILFLDDDVSIPDNNLIETYFRSTPTADVAVLVGGIRDIAPEPANLVARHAVARSALGHLATWHDGPGSYAHTANAMVRRAAFADVNGFDATLSSGGDADFCFRVIEQGWRLSPAFAATVDHVSRSTVGGLFRQYRKYGAGAAWLAERYPAIQQVPSRSRLPLVLLKKLALGFRAVTRRDREQLGFIALDAVSMIGFYRGLGERNVATGAPGIDTR